MGREDSLRAPSRWERGSLSGRIALSGTRFPAMRMSSLSQAPAAPLAAPVTAGDADRLQALLGRVVEEMKSRGKDPSGILQVKAKLSNIAAGTSSGQVMSLTQQDIQTMENSLQQMTKAIDWTAIAILGTAIAVVGSAAWFLTD